MSAGGIRATLWASLGARYQSLVVIRAAHGPIHRHQRRVGEEFRQTSTGAWRARRESGRDHRIIGRQGAWKWVLPDGGLTTLGLQRDVRPVVQTVSQGPRLPCERA
jgi:hypothetical protein